MNDPAPIRRRKPVNISLDSKLIEEARSLGINVSRACEAGLAEVTQAARKKKWQEDNAAAIASSNAFVEKYGLPLEKFRAF